MPHFAPLKGLRPSPEFANQVAAPPYDVLTSEEARQRAGDNRYSFLHVSKAEIDLPRDANVYSDAVYAKARENLDHLVAQGVLQRDIRPCFYVYRMTMGSHTQTGIMGLASVSDYDSDRVKRHELTRPDKEDDRVRHMAALNAQTGPVLLAYRSLPAIDALLAAATVPDPDIDVLADTGVTHTLWVINDVAQCAQFAKSFESLDAFYIADGHHRAASASRTARAHRASASAQSFLAAAFPHNQMRILDYNRVVSDLNGLSMEALRRRLEGDFQVTPASARVAPLKRGEFGMYVQGRWFHLRARPHLLGKDTMGALDVSLLSDHVLAPVFNIQDLRRDKRIDFIGGIRGLEALEQRVDQGQDGAAFALFPTSMEELMAVADSGLTMPPKSTWFEPKLADGLVSHLLD